MEKKDCLTLEEETGCTETSVQEYHSTLQTIPEKHISFAIWHKLEIMQVIHFLSAEILILYVCFSQWHSL